MGKLISKSLTVTHWQFWRGESQANSYCTAINQWAVLTLIHRPQCLLNKLVIQFTASSVRRSSGPLVKYPLRIALAPITAVFWRVLFRHSGHPSLHHAACLALRKVNDQQKTRHHQLLANKCQGRTQDLVKLLEDFWYIFMEYGGD